MAAVRIYRPSEGSAQPLTVETLIGLYLRHAKAEAVHGDAARADREYTFRLFIEACGSLPVSEAKPFHLTDFIESHPEWKSVATRRQKSSEIRAAFNWAFKQERIPRNPFANVRYKEAERRPEIPDDALDRINGVANKPTERLLTFIRLTGCRASEVCDAVWGDVDLDRGLWVIEKHKGRKHTGRAKIVALVGEAVALLRSIAATRATLDDTRTAARRDVDKAGMPALAEPIFLNTQGKPWSRRNLWAAVNRFKKVAGVTNRGGVHAIRHTFATAAVANGAPIALVAAQLGNTIQVTEAYYVDVTGRLDAIRAAAALGSPKK